VEIFTKRREGRKMLVKYNAESGVKGIPLVDLNPEAVKDSGSVRGQVIVLVPGWNEIEQDIWPNAEPTMEDEFKAGVFEYTAKDAEDANGNPVRIQITLADVRADKARKIVEGCFNHKNLEKWKDDPKLTAELRALADIQLKKILSFGEEGR
jgi:hypothetical protein